MANRMSAKAKPDCLPAENFASETFLPRRLPSWFVASMRTARAQLDGAVSRVDRTAWVRSDIESHLPEGPSYDRHLRQRALDVHTGRQGGEKVVSAAEDARENLGGAGHQVFARPVAEVSLVSPAGTVCDDGQDVGDAWDVASRLPEGLGGISPVT